MPQKNMRLNSESTASSVHVSPVCTCQPRVRLISPCTPPPISGEGREEKGGEGQGEGGGNDGGEWSGREGREGEWEELERRQRGAERKGCPPHCLM